MRDKLRKRIAIFLPNLGGGGAERVALASANDLARRGHHVDLLLIRSGGELIPLLSPKVKVIEFHESRMIASLPHLIRYLRGARPDALHAVMWPVTIIAVIAHKLARSRAMLVVSDQVALSQQITRRRQRLLLEWSTRVFYPLADVRIACSAAAADDLARLSRLPRGKFEVIYNPICPPKRIVATEEAEQLWKGNGPRIITVGSMKEQKNHALLLEAFARLPDREAQLMILGEGLLRAALERRAAALGIADRLVMPGFRLDPWPFLASANLFVLSSDYEGFANVVAEALYAGLKVVSTDCVAGPGEILDGGRYGTLVPCRDPGALSRAIEAALADQPDAKRLRARALEVSGPRTIERYAELLAAKS